MNKILAAVLVLGALQGQAQKVSNQLSFPKGAKLQMVTTTNSVITVDMMGQSLDTKVDATITRMFDIEDASANSATIEHKVKRLQTKFESPMAGSQSFDSENEQDMKSEGGKIAEKGLKNKYTMTVDRAGKITAVKADDDNPNKTADAGTDMMANMLSQMADGFGLPKVGDASEFRILPEREVSRGDTWTDTTGGVNRTYTLSDVTDNDIIVSFTGTGSTSRKQETQGMEININTKDSYTGRLVIDRKTGILKEKTENIDSDGTMEMMGQSVPMKSKMTRSTVVTRQG